MISKHVNGCYAATQLALQLHQERTQVCSNKEAPKEEFGRMIFQVEKKSSLGDRKVQSTPSAVARGGEAWRWNM